MPVPILLETGSPEYTLTQGFHAQIIAIRRGSRPDQVARLKILDNLFDF